MSNSPNIFLNNPDALSSVLSRLDLRADVYVNGDFCGAWAIDSSGSRRIPFHLVGRGEAWLHVEGEPAKLLSSGDLVLFPRAERVNAELEVVDGPVTQLICGAFEFHNKAAWPLLDSLAPVIVLDLSDMCSTPAARTLIDLMVGELNQAAPGHYAAVNQLALLLFVQVIRQQIDAGSVDSGLLAALFHPRISRALGAIHNRPEERWTLESLAREAAMGRSSFAQQFNELTGIPPMQYLAVWRMQEAKLLLETTRTSVAEIAERCGYESEAAFRKAFRKITGQPPGEVRRNAAVK
jgi:AraC-like DNA-binding protein